MELNEKIAAVVAESERALSARIEALMVEHEAQALAPVPGMVRALHAKHNDVLSLIYVADDMDVVRSMITAWQDKFGPFLPIAKYRKGCVVVTAYPWGEYTEDCIEGSVANAVHIDSHVGDGFNSLEFSFFPSVPGKRYKVSIQMAFRTYVPAFSARVQRRDIGYGRYEYKRIEPPITRDCLLRVLYSSGSPSTVHWVGAMDYTTFIDRIS